MKKYITIAALLAAGSAVANAATVSEVNTSIDELVDYSKYTVGDSFNLTFTMDSVIEGGRESILTLADDWAFVTQIGRFIGFDVGGDGPSGWYGGSATTEPFAYASVVPGETDLWVVDASGNDNHEMDGGIIAGSIVSLYTFDESVYLNVYKPDYSATYLMTVDVGDVSLKDVNIGAAVTGISNATLTIKGTEYTLPYSIPEPSAFGLLAGLGALALVASRRRRK